MFLNDGPPLPLTIPGIDRVHNFTGSGSGPGPRLTGPGPVCDFWAGPGPGPAVKKAKKIPNFLKMTSVASNENLSIQANEIYSRAKITPDNNNKVKY